AAAGANSEPRCRRLSGTHNRRVAASNPAPHPRKPRASETHSGALGAFIQRAFNETREDGSIADAGHPENAEEAPGSRVILLKAPRHATGSGHRDRRGRVLSERLYLGWAERDVRPPVRGEGALAAVIARTGPSNMQSTPSPVDFISRPRCG